MANGRALLPVWHRTKGLPWHQTNQQDSGILYPAVTFREIFNKVFALCVDSGLVSDHQSVDSAPIKQCILDKRSAENAGHLHGQPLEESGRRKSAKPEKNMGTVSPHMSQLLPHEPWKREKHHHTKILRDISRRSCRHPQKSTPAQQQDALNPWSRKMPVYRKDGKARKLTTIAVWRGYRGRGHLALSRRTLPTAGTPSTFNNQHAGPEPL